MAVQRAKVGNNGAKGGPLLLAIESSCDDTSAAVLEGFNVRSNLVAGQAVHNKYGGVVPELASRAHQQNIVPVVSAALAEAGVLPHQLDAIAFTLGPGLMGSLHVGVSFAKAMGLALNLPLVAVDHMQAHVLAHFIIDGDKPQPQFPFLCLTVSGGHTQIVQVDGPLSMAVIGRTLDDAAGEAFDKAAKMMGLGYPGGPIVDRLAKEGDASKFTFSPPKVAEHDMSFSGFKTSLLYLIQRESGADPGFVEANLPHLCASYQKAVVGYLLKKMAMAVTQTGIRHVALAGGVSANSALRGALTELGQRNGWHVFVPKFEYCTDNAAMIGCAAQFLLADGRTVGQNCVPFARGIH